MPSTRIPVGGLINGKANRDSQPERQRPTVPATPRRQSHFGAGAEGERIAASLAEDEPQVRPALMPEGSDESAERMVVNAMPAEKIPASFRPTLRLVAQLRSIFGDSAAMDIEEVTTPDDDEGA